MARESRQDQARVARTPVHENRNRLSVAGLDPNFYHRWVNDVDEALATYLEAGYEFVEKDRKKVGDPTVDTSQGTDSRIRKGVGGGVVAYLMRLPMELWKADQAAKDQDLKEMERAIRSLSKNTAHPLAQEADYGEFKQETRSTK